MARIERMEQTVTEEMKRLENYAHRHTEGLSLEAWKEHGCETPTVGKSKKPSLSTKKK